MRVLAEVEVETTYRGKQKITQIEIFTELDEHKNIGWKVDGSNGSRHYLIGYHYDPEDAVRQFSEIQCRLLKAQEKSIK